MGPARVWRRAALDVDWRAHQIADVGSELDRFDRAIEMTRAELGSLREQLRERLGREHASILDAQLLILEDQDFLGVVRVGIERDGLTAEVSFTRAMAEALIPLDLSGDTLFRERIVDFRDVEQRVVRALTGGGDPMPDLTEPCILVTPQLTPSETASLDFSNVIGFVVDEGGAMGHTAIIARSLGVPAVVGLGRASKIISDGTRLALDGAAGLVYVEPDDDTLFRFDVRMRRRKRAEERLLKLKNFPAETKDGHRVELSANIELPHEVDLAIENGANGIGLVRTEYFYFRAAQLPTEDEQYENYRRLVERVGGDDVIFRTLDVGGDKLLAAVGGVREYNPFLGLRGARFLLSNPEILHTQLRALYRASAHGPMKIMFPMVCDLDELRAFHQHAAEVRGVLAREGYEFDADLDLGIMIETPSAVAMARELAAECDFFSIGTNDLTQYLLAVDRTNARVAHLAHPQHPAVLRAIRETVEAGHAAGIWVGCCGEMGSNPLFAVLLVGLGIDEISTHAAAVPVIKKAIRSLSLDQARTWAEQALTLSTVRDVDRFLRLRAKEQMRDFLEESDDVDEARPKA